jgi:hypothetical protein
MQFLFSDQVLDTDRRELSRGRDRVSIEPQVFDLLVFLMQNRDRVVSKDDLIAAVWDGRIVSESTLTSRINAARKAIGDSDRTGPATNCGTPTLILQPKLARRRALSRRRSTGPPSRCFLSQT